MGQRAVHCARRGPWRYPVDHELLRCATHVVADLDAATERFGRWLDHPVVERGAVSAEPAAAWGAPATGGRRYAVCRPASGADVFLRFIEGDDVPAYRPIRSHGWNAIEICVQDVLAVAERLTGSPFEVIGPPTLIAGLPTIYPMQVRGPDQEIVYLTQILTDDPASGLPRAIRASCPNVAVHCNRPGSSIRSATARPFRTRIFAGV